MDKRIHFKKSKATTKIGPILLVVCMVISCLTGCGKKESTAIVDDNYRNYYEIFVRSFRDSDGDRIGDLEGVTQQLDYIADTGFNGIWLMPISQSTTYHKYDVVDYCSIDEEYGTLEDFDRLTEECHQRGINLVIDMVLNHTSSRHEWFLEACRYLRTLEEGQEPDPEVCPYVSYYHFSREKVDGTWSKVAGVDWYYESVFWSEMPDLNLDSEAVWQEIEEICDFWIDRGVDGFRLDAVAHYAEGDVSYNNEVLNRMYSYCLTKNPDFYLVSEAWLSEATVAQYYASGTPSFFNFDAAGAEGKIIATARGTGTAVSFVKTLEKYETDFSASNPDYIDGAFISNHDMNRSANMVMSDVDTLKMAAGLLMTMQGSTFVYYGEEIGMKSKGTADENKRLAFYWSEENKEGTTMNPTGADSDVKSSLAALDEQQKDKDSLYNYYCRALAFRNANPLLARGSVQLMEEYSQGNVAVALRSQGDEQIYLVYNTGKETVEMDISGLGEVSVRNALTLHPGEKVKYKKGVLSMPGRSIVVLQ